MAVNAPSGTQKRVAIIGAGIAGLSCGTALQAAGLNVSVFEKSRGVGGRMSTRRGTAESSAVTTSAAQSPAWVCDHGAPWFTAESAAFQAEVAKWHEAGAVAYWRPKEQSDTGRAKETKQPPPSSQRLVGVPHMTSPASYLAIPLAVSHQTTIVGLECCDHQWQLCTAESGVLADRFDTVALAVPAPQAVPLLRSAATALTEPSVSGTLSAMATTAAAIRMRGTWVLMLQFDDPVPMPFDTLVCGEGPLALMVRNSAKPGRRGLESWVMHASVEWSEAHLEEPAEVITAAMLATFTARGGPTPRSSALHRWRYATTETAPTPGTAWDEVAQLGMCGDWLAGGTVEAAWQSGQQLARQIIGKSGGDFQNQ